MLPDTWIPHTRPDGETVGWIEPVDDAFVVHDRLGRTVGEPVDWLTAEETLDALGIGFLAERWLYPHTDGTPRPVRISEVTADHVDIVTDDFGAAAAVGATLQRIRLPFPAPAELRRA
ncbi:hypothetical protein [Microbacterium sp. SORGH_AS_0888]|uniref:hypothetical protein n=1 Tax=Microbacterium sp. SORGH_AS_0888 TaxID=3041791 RepID=UPI0027802BBB|nr:hypothetical protein [Microbacterium sp. SORGH_AS_0888]MDQ1129190.1 hypothetical protein [Microbacterium sp. SORGH_AS_0888]